MLLWEEMELFYFCFSKFKMADGRHLGVIGAIRK